MNALDLFVHVLGTLAKNKVFFDFSGYTYNIRILNTHKSSWNLTETFLEFGLKTSWHSWNWDLGSQHRPCCGSQNLRGTHVRIAPILDLLGSVLKVAVHYIHDLYYIPHLTPDINNVP